MGKKRITMSIDDEIFCRFRDFCQNNAMKVSSKVELLIKQDLQQAQPRTEAETKQKRGRSSKKIGVRKGEKI